MKKITVTIGIPTYNAENNIVSLINSLVIQTELTCTITKIIIHSDNSTDNTDSLVKKITDKRVTLIKSNTRKGMAHGFIKMIRQCETDVFVLLNDDIFVNDIHLIDKVVVPFLKNKNTGLTSGNPQPLRPHNLIQSAGISTFRAYERVRYLINQGKNKYTCDGKMLVLSKEFIQSLTIPDDLRELGNVDAYLYFSCLVNGFDYEHVQLARIYFSFPTSVVEYIRWYSRNNANQLILQKKFGQLVEKEYALPKGELIKSELKELLNHPLRCIVALVLGTIAKRQSKTVAKTFNPTWDVISSTKRRLYS